MAEITPDTVKNVAHLARLAVSEQEIKTYAQDLNQILALVDKMQTVYTKDIKPMIHPSDAQQRLREDEVTETNQRDILQSIAPNANHGLYLVPKVIE